LHGCFWALANRDLDRVGLTLLRIDAGVDTGPSYGYFSYPYDQRRESHEVIQKRNLLERLIEVQAGEATPIDTSGRHSAAIYRVGAYVLAIAFFADLSVRAIIARQRPSLCSAPHLERNEAAEVQYTMAWTTLHVLGLDATLIEGPPAHCEQVLRRDPDG
jgi:hypothetical protein